MARKTVQTKFVSGSIARVDLAPLKRVHCREFQKRTPPQSTAKFGNRSDRQKATGQNSTGTLPVSSSASLAVVPFVRWRAIKDRHPAVTNDSWPAVIRH